MRKRLGSCLDALAEALAPKIRELLTPGFDGGDLQSKFSQDTRGMLKYGNLSTFFGGLEGSVGSPDPKVLKAMEEEHTGARTRIAS